MTGPLATVQIASLPSRPLSRCTPATAHLRAIDTNLNRTSKLNTHKALVESACAIVQKHIPTVKVPCNAAEQMLSQTSQLTTWRSDVAHEIYNEHIDPLIVCCFLFRNGLATTPAHSSMGTAYVGADFRPQNTS